jgi:hypothetical protein
MECAIIRIPRELLFCVARAMGAGASIRDWNSLGWTCHWLLDWKATLFKEWLESLQGEQGCMSCARSEDELSFIRCHVDGKLPQPARCAGQRLITCAVFRSLGISVTYEYRKGLFTVCVTRESGVLPFTCRDMECEGADTSVERRASLILKWWYNLDGEQRCYALVAELSRLTTDVLERRLLPLTADAFKSDSLARLCNEGGLA